MNKEYLIVLNKDEDTVSFVNLTNQLVEKTIETDYNPHEVVVTPDGKKTYVTCSLGNKINIIDNDTFEIIKKVEHEDFNFPHGLGVTNDGQKLYMASTYSEKVFIIDTATDSIEKVIPTYQKYSHMISFSPNGETVYVPNIGSDNITVVNVNKEEIINHFPVGKGPEGVAVHPNGKELYVANQEDNTLFVIDTESLETLHKRRIGTCPIRIVFSPNGKYALIPNRESGDLSIIDTKFELKGTVKPWEVKRIRVGVWPGGTVFNEDGSKAFVANNKTNDVSIINMETLEEEGRIKVGIHPDGIAYLKK
ncbi:YncE family protein [Litchfieldia alkalitelluris]|uniref:YncE family protein n=1 Tax=Litchfieldia alkalitelluris TaxID=304268 RepID=UPI00099726E3|nr:YncE family protein [Litchfieldia alkalitelluris]